jgi:hypothetical protein
MPQCPQCNKPLVQLSRQCPSCRADLDLLVDYVHGLQNSLDRADQFTRAGELGQAVWAYLEILEVDPDNAEARRQVGQVATAVRQFDRTLPGRRWAQGLPALAAQRAWLQSGVLLAVASVLVVTAFALGYLCAGGWSAGERASPEKTEPELPMRKANQLGG